MTKGPICPSSGVILLVSSTQLLVRSYALTVTLSSVLFSTVVDEKKLKAAQEVSENLEVSKILIRAHLELCHYFVHENDETSDLL